MDSLYKIFVRSYCLREVPDAEFHALIEDIYFTEEVQSLERFPQHSTVNRLNHITAVAYMTYNLAKKFNLDCKAAARGAVLHDLFYYDWHEDDLSHKLHGLRHPKFALNNAFYLCGTLTKREQDIIKRHMWPLTIIPPKYPESFIVTMMYKYCATIESAYSTNKSFRKKLDNMLGLEK